MGEVAGGGGWGGGNIERRKGEGEGILRGRREETMVIMRGEGNIEGEGRG